MYSIVFKSDTTPKLASIGKLQNMVLVTEKLKTHMTGKKCKVESQSTTYICKEAGVLFLKELNIAR